MRSLPGAQTHFSARVRTESRTGVALAEVCPNRFTPPAELLYISAVESVRGNIERPGAFTRLSNAPPLSVKAYPMTPSDGFCATYMRPSASHHTRHSCSVEGKTGSCAEPLQFAVTPAAPPVGAVTRKSSCCGERTLTAVIFCGRYVPVSGTGPSSVVVLTVPAYVLMVSVSVVERSKTEPSDANSASYTFGNNVFVRRVTDDTNGSATRTLPDERSAKYSCVEDAANPAPETGVEATFQRRGAGLPVPA